jgi:molecular chaperone DnaK
MSYYLGIDLGTTYTGAARFSDGRGEIITLGDRSAVVPSVLFFRDDGDVLAGDPAVRRGLSEPTRVVREFKRRMGDPTPIMVGAAPYSADSLMAELFETILGLVSQREGGPAEGLGVTHPANWGPYKLDILRQALRMADAGHAVVLSEPEAAAIHYAWTERLAVGEIVAVYDLGGGTFDAAVLRKTDSEQRFQMLGEAEGVERLGGIDFDEAVFQYVVRYLGSAISELDPDDPATIQGIARLRQECVNAKEALSSDTDVSVPVFLPNVQTEVRLVRGEFEAMIRPAIGQTIEALRRALRGAGVAPDDLAAVLLVGGSSKIPLVAQLVAAEVGRPIAVDIHPKHTVAMGAAIAAAFADGGSHHRAQPMTVAATAERSGPLIESEPEPDLVPEAVPVPEPVLEPVSESEPEPVPVPVPVPGSEPVPEPEPIPLARPADPGSESEPSRNRGRILVGAGVAGVLAVVALVASSLGDGSGATNTTAATVAAVETTMAVVETTMADQTSTTEPSTTTTEPSTTTTTMPVREPEPLQVTEGVEGGSISVRVEAGDGASEVGVLGALTTFTTTGRYTEAEGGEWIELSEPVAGWIPAAATQAVEPGDRVTITGIDLDGDRYRVEYTANYEPLIAGGDEVHIHFFFDSVPVEQAGVPGNGPWILYDTPAPFSEYGPADRPEGATRLCATPATSDHRVVNPRIFHCMQLPDVEASAGLVTVSLTASEAFGLCLLADHTRLGSTVGLTVHTSSSSSSMRLPNGSST